MHTVGASFWYVVVCAWWAHTAVFAWWVRGVWTRGPVDPPSLSTCARPATVIGGPLGEIECQHELMRKSEVLRRDDVILSSLSLNVMCVTFFS